MPGAAFDARIVRENLEYRLEAFARLEKPETPTLGYCEAMDLAIERYRRYAICLMLTAADSEGFFENLSKAARLKLELLKWTRGTGAEFQRYTYFSNNAPFLGALAAGNSALAREIALAAEGEFNPDFEYEEDYTYTRFLYELAKTEFRADASLRPILEEFLEDVEGHPSPRYAVCQALLDVDQPAFREALTELVAEHEALFEKKGEGLIADPEEFATERFIFVEGLALKYIASRMGMELADEEPYMPREACVLAAGGSLT